MSILTQIENGMADLIGAMTEGDYNYTWDRSSVNQPDMAKCTYPSAQIILIDEINQDDLTAPSARSYMQQALFEIIVRARNPNESAVPVHEINQELNSALDDLKKLFGKNYSVSGMCDLIMYRGMTRITEPSGDIFIPKRMITRWSVQYAQDRWYPEMPAQ